MKYESRYQDVFQFYLNPKVVSARQNVAKAVFGSGILVRLALAFKFLIGNLYTFFVRSRAKPEDLKGKIWLVLGSRNQEAATAFLPEHFGIVVLSTDFYQAQVLAITPRWWPLPKVAYLPKYLPFLWSVFREDAKHFSMVFHLLVHGVGCLENHRKTLKKYRPQAVIVSNDSSPFFRALVVAAEELSIPTVYLQHASVSNDFPPLIADLSLLDGRDALDKYTSEGKTSRGAVKLVGSPKYDRFLGKINRSEQLTRLGIPYGFYDLPQKVENLVVDLIAAFPGLEITMRRHPRDGRPYPFENLPAKVAWSDSREESVYEFLARVDAIVASDSAVHLEATLLNVSSFYYPLLSDLETTVDIYGFVRNGLVPNLTTQEALFQQLSRICIYRPPVRQAAVYYVENIGTPDEGRSQELSVSAIKELLTGWSAKNV